MKKLILDLRNQGFSYKQIKEKVGCSLSTINYHCSEKGKENSKKRCLKNKKKNLKNIVKIKADNFNRKIYLKSREFQRSRENNRETNWELNIEDVLNKISNSKCYLTGRNIDLMNTRSYHFDHIIPKSKGGENNLSNLGLACREANFSKHDLSLIEYLELCKEVLINFGYSIINPQNK